MNTRPAITLASLAHHPNWVSWRSETRDGLTTKVPYDPRTGRRAASDDPNTWATHDEAQWWAAAHGAAGVGFMFSQIGDLLICGIDLDRCRDKATGEITSLAQAVIDRFATYTEVSPGETGVKLLFTVASANLPAVETLFDGKFGQAFKNGGDGERLPAIEVYRGRRFFTVTEEAIAPPTSCGWSTLRISDG